MLDIAQHVLPFCNDDIGTQINVMCLNKHIYHELASIRNSTKKAHIRKHIHNKLELFLTKHNQTSFKPHPNGCEVDKFILNGNTALSIRQVNDIKCYIIYQGVKGFELFRRLSDSLVLLKIFYERCTSYSSLDQWTPHNNINNCGPHDLVMVPLDYANALIRGEDVARIGQ